MSWGPKRTAGGVKPGHAESQGILSLGGDLAHLGGRQGICTCNPVSSGFQQDPFSSAQGSGVSGWHLQLPLASLPKFHRRSHSLPWKSRLVLHACGMSRGLLPFLPQLWSCATSLVGRAQ